MSETGVPALRVHVSVTSWVMTSSGLLLTFFRCSSGECIRLVRMCDGRCDCADTAVCEDETLMCDKESAFKDLVMFGNAKAAEMAGFAVS